LLNYFLFSPTASSDICGLRLLNKEKRIVILKHRQGAARIAFAGSPALGWNEAMLLSEGLDVSNHVDFSGNSYLSIHLFNLGF
jgi:hypothetical protein